MSWLPTLPSVPISGIKLKDEGDAPKPKHKPGAEGWTLYCRPEGFPDNWAVRRWEVLDDGSVAYDEGYRLFNGREDATAAFGKGRQWIPRHVSDDMCIVGSWV